MQPKINIEDEILIRYTLGEATPEEALRIEDWLTESPNNEALLKQWQTAWELAPTKWKSDEHADWQAVQTQISTRKTIWFTPLRMVAAIAALAIISLAVYNFQKPVSPEQHWITTSTVESPKVIQLKEGTQVTLNGQSKLSYPESFESDRRVVELKGEGFFEVTHDPSKPFIVQLDQVKIQVLGTSFNVLNDDTQPTLAIQVRDGKVKVFHKNEALILTQGEVGYFEKATKKLWKETVTTENNVAYATQVLQFNESDLKTVLADLSKAFHVKFELENADVNTCLFTGTYQKKSLRFILDVVTTALNLQYTVHGDTVQISGDGCL